MKKVLLASTALIMSAGIAAADVSVGGDGRMGVQDGFGDDGLRFTSRIRISFSASGETDAGLAFGGSIRADNAGGFNVTDQNGNTLGDDSFNATDIDDLDLTGGGGVLGQAGSVFIEGAFGKLSMGDVDGAAQAAVGHVSGVGLTGLSDLNESVYIANVGPNLPGAIYEYAAGDFGVFVSASNPGNVFTGEEEDVAWALGGSYSFGNFSVALGYEDNGAGTDHIIGGLTGHATAGEFSSIGIEAGIARVVAVCVRDGERSCVVGADATTERKTCVGFARSRERDPDPRREAQFVVAEAVLHTHPAVAANRHISSCEASRHDQCGRGKENFFHDCFPRVSITPQSG